MQCALCETRSAIGYCGTCRTLLCEVCGAACQGCGKGMCPGHRVRTAQGQTLCPACHAAHEARTLAGAPAAAKPSAAPAGPAPTPAASTSFSDLIADLGPPQVTVSPEPPRAASPAPTTSTPAKRAAVAVDADERPLTEDEIEARAMALLEKSMEEERHNARLLTGSASRGTPMWLSGAFIGGLACVLLLLVQGGSAIWDSLRYVVLLVGMGAVIWNGYGFYSKDQPQRSRQLCLIGLLLGIFAVFATLIRWSG